MKKEEIKNGNQSMIVPFSSWTAVTAMTCSVILTVWQTAMQILSGNIFGSVGTLLFWIMISCVVNVLMHGAETLWDLKENIREMNDREKNWRSVHQ